MSLKPCIFNKFHLIYNVFLFIGLVVSVNTTDAQCTSAGKPSLSIQDTSICQGISISVSIVGNLNDAVQWYWHTGSCGGTIVDSGVSVTLLPGDTTNYYVRGEGSGCVNPGDCDTLILNVRPKPVVDITTENPCTDLNGLLICATFQNSIGIIWGSNDGTFGNPTDTCAFYVPNGSVMPGNADLYVCTDGNGICNEECDSIIVIVTNLPIADAGADHAVCDSTPSILTGTDILSSGSSYLWTDIDGNIITNSINTPIQIRDSNTFIFRITDNNGCQNQDSVFISVVPLPNVTAPGDTSICWGDEIILTATGAQSYNWNNGIYNGIAFIPDSSYLYTVVGTDSNGCQNLDSTFITVLDSSVTPCKELSIHAISRNRDVEIFPNPTHGSFYVYVPQATQSNMIDLFFYNSSGELQETTKIHVGKINHIALVDFPRGMYYVQLHDKSGIIGSQKIMLK